MPTHNIQKIALSAIVALIAATSGSAYAAINFTFDNGTQGWSVVEGGALNYQSTGGNSGGFLQASDTSGADFLINAPTTSLGNWSTYLGGTLSFDAKNINGVAADWPEFGMVTIQGAGTTLQLDAIPDGEPAPGAGWIRYSVALTPTVWGANLGSVLGNVTRLTIKGEFHNGISEVVGFDNISVSAVPEPETYAMLLAGLGLMGAVARRKEAAQRQSAHCG